MPTQQLEKARIFLVGDASTDLPLLARILEGVGYTPPIIITDPLEIINHYREFAPDLILMDISFLYIDGFNVLAELRAVEGITYPPVMALTRQNCQEDRLMALAEGVRDFINKPFDRVELLMRVMNQLEVHMAHRMVQNHKMELERLVQERTNALNQSRLEIVRRLGRAAEYRDNETGLHIIRMSKYAALMARSLGWSDTECELLLHASPMHDIGKIGIPDAILLKPGKLDPTEWEIMQRHPLIGAEILEDGDSDLLHMARLIALSHHEKWDGSGYPYGLAGPQIPQASRIVAVADVFDALTSTRPYKKAWPIEDAVALLQDQSGSHFDPEVVEHFMRLLPEILVFRSQNLEPEIGS
ncbi:MAG: HD domain-containing protein [Burkholderiaceae bacterium]|nr:HD domain-containing protein [Burkholderiaceae bacterium]